MRLAIFDFDGTLFQHQSIPYLIKCYKKIAYERKKYLVFMIKILFFVYKYKNPFIKGYKKENFKQDAAVAFMQMFNNKSSEELTKFFTQCESMIIKDLNPVIVDEVRKSQEKGFSTVLLSGCLIDILEAIAIKLDIDYVIGTKYRINDNQKLNFSSNDFDIIMGERKTERLKEIMKDKDIDWENSLAYADSSYDESILRMVGKPVAVNPDSGLMSIAQLNGWTII